MTKWEKLEIDNLPADILTGDYEFADYDSIYREYGISSLTPYQILGNVINADYKYYYRKPEPKEPSHEEMMSKWWRSQYSDSPLWSRVTKYRETAEMGDLYFINSAWWQKEWFTDRESADIPPEHKT